MSSDKKRTTKNTRGSRKAVTLIVCLIIAAAIVAGIIIKNHFPQDEQITESQKTNNELNITRIAQDIALDTELIDVSVCGNTAKISCINPGLDTAKERIVIYNLKDNRVLSDTQLDEAFWVTGITENGFYTVSVGERILSIYDTRGKLLKQKDFSDLPEWSPACSLSDDASAFLYTALSDGQIYIYNVNDDTTQKIDTQKFYPDAVQFSNGKFFITNTNREMASLSPTDTKLDIVFSDDRSTVITPNFALANAEYSFAVSDIANSKVFYVPFTAADEIVVGNNSNCFVTAVPENDGSLVRLYDIKEKSLAEITVPDTVESVCPLDDGKMIIVAGDINKKEHRLYICTPEHKSNLVINENDE